MIVISFFLAFVTDLQPNGWFTSFLQRVLKYTFHFPKTRLKCELCRPNLVTLFVTKTLTKMAVDVSIRVK